MVFLTLKLLWSLCSGADVMCWGCCVAAVLQVGGARVRARRTDVRQRLRRLRPARGRGLPRALPGRGRALPPRLPLRVCLRPVSPAHCHRLQTAPCARWGSSLRGGEGASGSGYKQGDTWNKTWALKCYINRKLELELEQASIRTKTSKPELERPWL